MIRITGKYQIRFLHIGIMYFLINYPDLGFVNTISYLHQMFYRLLGGYEKTPVRNTKISIMLFAMIVIK